MYTLGSGWSQQYPAGWTPPLYPRMHLSTDGRVFYAGSTRSSRFFNPSTGTWSAIVATTNHSASRTYGTSVLLPLTPANSYRPRVMIFGGGNPATATTEIIDLLAPTPVWQFGPSMSQPRIQMNATILPNGKVLATGGSTNDEDALTASRNADLYDRVTNTFSPAGANAFPRLYHSNALLLPDATVLLMGGNPSEAAMKGDWRSIRRPTCSMETVRLRCVRPLQGRHRKR
jgi:galactose oxidase